MRSLLVYFEGLFDGSKRIIVRLIGAGFFRNAYIVDRFIIAGTDNC
jgi:hypothetical protein